jgi:glycosyltransferase involved in cell wall biosynthesis
MSEKRIIYPIQNGGVAIIIPALNAKNTNETYDEFIERIAAKDVPFGLPHKIVSVEDIPTDRTFRDAWEYPVDQQP